MCWYIFFLGIVALAGGYNARIARQKGYKPLPIGAATMLAVLFGGFIGAMLASFGIAIFLLLQGYPAESVSSQEFLLSLDSRTQLILEVLSDMGIVAGELLLFFISWIVVRNLTKRSPLSESDSSHEKHVFCPKCGARQEWNDGAFCEKCSAELDT